MYDYHATVADVIDGDTLRLDVDLGFGIQTTMAVRLAGINAPEISTQAGKDAKAYVMDWVWGAAREVTLRTIKDRREKYGRYLGTIHYRGSDTTSLNDLLVEDGHAVRYSGGPR